MKKKAGTAPKNEGLLPPAQKDAVRTKIREQRTPIDGEEEKQSTGYVVDRVFDSRVDGQPTLYRVRLHDYGPGDDTRKLAKHLPQQNTGL